MMEMIASICIYALKLPNNCFLKKPSQRRHQTPCLPSKNSNSGYGSVYMYSSNSFLSTFPLLYQPWSNRELATKSKCKWTIIWRWQSGNRFPYYFQRIITGYHLDTKSWNLGTNYFTFQLSLSHNVHLPTTSRSLFCIYNQKCQKTLHFVKFLDLVRSISKIICRRRRKKSNKLPLLMDAFGIKLIWNYFRLLQNTSIGPGCMSISNAPLKQMSFIT